MCRGFRCSELFLVSLGGVLGEVRIKLPVPVPLGRPALTSWRVTAQRSAPLHPSRTETPISDCILARAVSCEHLFLPYSAVILIPILNYPGAIPCSR